MFSEYSGNDQSQTAEDIVRWCLGFTFSVTIIQLCHPSSHTEWLFALVHFKYFPKYTMGFKFVLPDATDI